MGTGKQRSTFISYSRVNKEFAVKLARELKSSGFSVWLDQLDIPPGARWDDELELALERCEIFMVILTPASMASDNVKDEIGYAIDNRKRILPILLENATIPLRLRRFQYVDFTGKAFDEGVEGAKDLLRRLIDEPTMPRMEIPPAFRAPDAQADEAMREETKRLAAQQAERLAELKAEEERKAREEADRLAAQRAEAERLAKQKAEEEQAAKSKSEAERKAKAEAKRKAKEEADRLAAQSKAAEEERLAAEKAEQERLAQANQDAARLVARTAEEGRLAKAKAEEDRKAKEETDQVTRRQAEEERQKAQIPSPSPKPVSPAPARKSRLPALMIGGTIGLVVCVAVAVVALSIFNKAAIPVRGSQANDSATDAQFVAGTSTEAQAVVDTATLPPLTSIPTAISNFVLLDPSETSKVYADGPAKGIYKTASEQHSDAELQAFDDKNQPIPVTLDNTVTTLIGIGWCATTETVLADNLKYIRIGVFIDEMPVPAEKFAEIHYTDTDTDGTNWQCVWRIAGVNQWASGEHTVRQEFSITQTINDGKTDSSPEHSTTNYAVTVP